MRLRGTQVHAPPALKQRPKRLLVSVFPALCTEAGSFGRGHSLGGSKCISESACTSAALVATQFGFPVSHAAALPHVTSQTPIGPASTSLEVVERTFHAHRQSRSTLLAHRLAVPVDD